MNTLYDLWKATKPFWNSDPSSIQRQRGIVERIRIRIYIQRVPAEGQQWRHRQRKQTVAMVGAVRRRACDEWESRVKTYALPYVKQKASGNLLYDSGNSNQCSVTTQRGGTWEGGSRGRGLMYPYGWFILMYGRNQHNIVKQLSFN